MRSIVFPSLSLMVIALFLIFLTGCSTTTNVGSRKVSHHEESYSKDGAEKKKRVKNPMARRLSWERP